MQRGRRQRETVPLSLPLLSALIVVCRVENGLTFAVCYNFLTMNEAEQLLLLKSRLHFLPLSHVRAPYILRKLSLCHTIQIFFNFLIIFDLVYIFSCRRVKFL